MYNITLYIHSIYLYVFVNSLFYCSVLRHLFIQQLNQTTPTLPSFFEFLAAADWGEEEHIEVTKKFCLIDIRVLVLSSRGLIPPWSCHHLFSWERQIFSHLVLVLLSSPNIPWAQWSLWSLYSYVQRVFLNVSRGRLTLNCRLCNGQYS